MDKYIYDESNGLWYELQGDYYIPCITLPTEKEHKFIGLWGQRYKRYLQEHKRAVYTTLLTSGKLNGYLADIDEQAMDMMFRLVEQMADKEGVTEQLKAENPMLWVVRMNEIQARAREIINREIILIILLVVLGLWTKATNNSIMWFVVENFEVSIAIAGVSVVAICGLSFVLSNLFFRKKYI